MAKKHPQRCISKFTSKKAVTKNAKAFEAYDYYRRTRDLVERSEVALGRTQSFESKIGSPVNCEVNQHGISSTAA
ncbi:MAG: hypothetical protein OXU40_02185 [Nitrospira sp.]|nr:hypothetical protein [Nitrospira sp.]